MTRSFIAAVVAEYPDAVSDVNAATPTVAPGSVGAVARLLQLANAHSTKLAFAGHGGQTACVLSLENLVSVRDVDVESRIVHVDSGAPMASAETAAAERGWTFGEASQGTTVLDWLHSRGVGAGEDDDPVLQVLAGAVLVLANGEVLTVRPAPRRAVGPDLLPAFVAAQGRLGIVASVYLVAREGALTSRLWFDFPTGDAARAAIAWIRGRGVRPRQALVNGTRVLIELSSEGPRGEAAERIVRDVVGARGGRPVSDETGRRVSPEPAKPWPLSRAVVKLAQQLDPAGVLQP